MDIDLSKYKKKQQLDLSKYKTTSIQQEVVEPKTVLEPTKELKTRYSQSGYEAYKEMVGGL